MEKRGAIISEFAMGTFPGPQNFPIRNRIISGMSLGVVVVEGAQYSGSLITARLAMEFGREVYGVPGNATQPTSFGPNQLIKQGAKLVTSWEDVIEELPTPSAPSFCRWKRPPARNAPCWSRRVWLRRSAPCTICLRWTNRATWTTWSSFRA